MTVTDSNGFDENNVKAAGQFPMSLSDLKPEELSPMMQHYAEMKEKCRDSFLLYRLGDFYEMFFDDAVKAAKILELALTRRDCGSGYRAPMCGIPFHAYSTYANRLVQAGYKVAICEQLEDPSVATGLVKRGIIKILTPGTITESGGLEDRKNNFLMSIYCVGSQFGVACADISTGDFEATQLTLTDNGEHLINLIGKYSPSEIIYNSNFEGTPEIQAIRSGTDIALTRRNDRDFSESLFRNSGAAVQDAKLFNNPEMMYCACSALILYAEETQTDKVTYLDVVRCYKISDTMELDIATRTGLELTSTIRTKQKKGSLLWAIDRTKTSMGARLLRKWVEEPLISVKAINRRLDAVEEAKEKYMARQQIMEGLSGLYDIERLAGKVSLGTCNARDMLSLRNSLRKIPFVREGLEEFSKGMFKEIKTSMDPLTDIAELLEKSINEDAPVTVKDGDIIKRGYNAECDELYDLAKNAKEYILQLENNERERTGIKTLKIGYNKVFGYFIDIPRSQSDKIPEEYVRKQTLVNNERYITPQIKELEDKIVSSSSRRIALEYELFTEVREKVCAVSDKLFGTARAIAQTDVITSLAELAEVENYVKPSIDDSEIIEIKGGRHPVVEQMMRSSHETFVPNDITMDEEKRLMVLTGPNMAGKSTFMRQTALIVLMAQIGSFVPAQSAKIGLVDHIFTRIGASDDISTGQSTFMVEMREVSYILKNATRKSLLLLDEVGRGTSTYDGLSIAWAVIEYIIDPNILYSRTIFATHYHELNQLERLNRGVYNNHVEVKEEGDSVTFLHKISDGGTSDSYGIEVARLAGLPSDVLKRSRAILSELERIGKFKVKGNRETMGNDEELSKDVMPGQESFFNPDNVVYRKEDKIRQTLRELDPTRLTPIEAMNILYELKQKCSEEDIGQD